MKGVTAMTEEKKQYLAEYRKAKLHRIPLDVSNELYDRIKAAADAQGRSVNNFIKFHIDNAVKSYENMNNRTW